MVHYTRWGAGIAAAAAIVLVAGCGTPGGGANAKENADAFTKYGAMTAAQRDPELAKLAAKEGTIKIYTSFQDMDKLATAFQKKYPGVKTSVYRADSETVFAKVQQEDAAGRTQADVVESSANVMESDVQAGILTDKYKVDPANMVAGAVHPGWTASRFKAFFVSWNTNNVKGADVPTSYQDLENPKWKGKIAIEIGDYQWYAGLHAYFTKQGMTDAAITSMWDKIAANARVVKGHTSTADLLASGEYSVFVDSYDDGILALQQKHAPVAYRDASGKVAVEPVYTDNSAIGVTAKAPHPAGAMLFTDYFLSQEGQKLVNDEGNIPAYKDINHELDGVPTITAPLLVGETSKKWEDAYAAVLQHATKG